MEKKFLIDQKSLQTILASMQPICTKRTALETTSYIHFQVGPKELILKSTDLEISLQSSCPLLESSLDEPCSFLVSGRRIFEVVKELDGLITCTLSAHDLSLFAKDAHVALNIKEAQEFPPFPERIENLMHLEAPLLQKMLDSVAFLIPQNNANPGLTGLYLEVGAASFTMTTTDGHCLAQVSTTEATLEEPKTWLLPRRAVFELKKILETISDNTIFLGICGNQLVFSGELFNFFTRLLAEPFPNYKTIMNKTAFQPATIDRTRLLKTLRRTVSLLSNQFISTRFEFLDNNVRVSLQNKEVGSLDEQFTFQGSKKTNMEIRMYSPYLLNGIQSFKEDVLQFYLKSGSHPLIFESETQQLSMTYLVMPVAPSKEANKE